MQKQQQKHKWIIPVLIIVFLLAVMPGMAQTGTLTGIIQDNSQTPIEGASITVFGTEKSVVSDSAGNFEISLPAGTYNIEVTATGFASRNIAGVAIERNKSTALEITLSISSITMEDVVIHVPVKKGSINTMLRYQKNTASIVQVISSEAMSKTPDNSTSDVLKRVTGLSVQEGKYLNVRGLGDRYNQAVLNGMLLSSTEPDRKAFSFDLFPASMIENILIEKTFLPEHPAEWAGGLIRIETKEIPNKDFVNLKAGTGFNTKTIGKPFFQQQPGKYDWLGLDDGTRGLPANMPGRNGFASLSDVEKNEWGKKIAGGNWDYEKRTDPLATINRSFQVNGGFAGKIFGKEAGGTMLLSYNRSFESLDYVNRFYNISDSKADVSFNYLNKKYAQNAVLGAMGNLALKLNQNHRLKFNGQFNSTSSIYTTLREGKDYEANSITGESIKAYEYGFKSNLFATGQISGEHTLFNLKTKLDWYGSLGVLDQYIPHQQRLQYNSQENNDEWIALLSNTLSQKTGSVFYGHLNDLIYNAGTKLKQDFNIKGVKQTIKLGYNLQVKDRSYVSRPFGIRLPSGNPALLKNEPETIFSPEHFDQANGFRFDEISGIYYQYIANSLLNAGFIQFENNFNSFLSAAWGVRFEHFDQIVGSKNPNDPRYSHNVTSDFLPAINVTARLSNNTNLRIAGSKTVIRPEFRELTGMAFYDFELGATVVGNPNLRSTNVTNFDLRYELYPNAGELVTAALFYKHFNHPIELAYNQTGAGSSSTFNYLNNQYSKANTYGAEIEFRKHLSFIPALKNLTLQGNFSYLFSKVNFETKSLDRPMQGQSPYLVNAGIQYEASENGWSGMLLFNQYGRRILYVGNESVPAIWEAPRPLFDAQIAKDVLSKRGKITLNLVDILSSSAKFYHDLNQDQKFKSGDDALVIQRKPGTGISISFNYQLK